MSKINILPFLLLLHTFDFIYCSYNTKIVGGHEASISKYPYMAAIVFTRSTHNSDDCICGSTILSSLWLLSAGHCCFDAFGNVVKSKYFSAIVGSTHCFNHTNSNYQKIRIVQIVVHPNYKLEESGGIAYVYNDIALFGLEEDIDFSQANIRTVPLATSEWLAGKHPEEVLRRCVTAGWGIQEYGSARSLSHLYAVELPLFSSKQCHEMYQEMQDPIKFQIYFDVDTAVCTMFPGGGQDVCSGDSGGPLICNGHQVGVVSMGQKCAEDGVPNIWTRVDRYYSWIRSVMRATKSKRRARASLVSSFPGMLLFGTVNKLF